MSINKKLKHTRYFIVNTFNNHKYLFIFLYILLFILTYYIAFTISLNMSQDMQWYPSTLFWQGLNPYQEYLDGRKWFLAQAPNYAHLLYILMYPLVYIEWENVKIIWAILNITLFTSIIFLFLFKGKTSLTFLLFILFFLIAGHPILKVIWNGQISIIILFFTTIAWLYRKESFILTSIALSIIFIKYSFGLPILLSFLLAGYYKEVIIAVLINLLAIIFYSFIFDISIIDSILLPIKVAMIATNIGAIDLISLERLLIQNNFIDIKISYFLIIFIFLLYVSYILKNYRYLSENTIISSGILLSISTFFHFGYDHIILLIVILILKERFQSTHLLILLVSFLSIFLWQCGRNSLLYILNIECISYMGIPYKSILSTLTIWLSFYILYRDKRLGGISKIS